MAHVDQSGEHDEVLAQIRQLVQKSNQQPEPKAQSDDALMDPTVRSLLAPESPNRHATKALEPVDDLRDLYQTSLDGAKATEAEEPKEKSSALGALLGIGKSASALLSRRTEPEQEPVLKETSFDQKLGQVFVKPTPVQEPAPSALAEPEADPATGLRSLGALQATTAPSEQPAQQPQEPATMRRFGAAPEGQAEAHEPQPLSNPEESHPTQLAPLTAVGSNRFTVAAQDVANADDESAATPITQASPFLRFDAKDADAADAADAQEADVIPLQDVMEHAAQAQAEHVVMQAAEAQGSEKALHIEEVAAPIADAQAQDAAAEDEAAPVMSFASRRLSAVQTESVVDAGLKLDTAEATPEPAPIATVTANDTQSEAPDAAKVQEVMANILEQELATKLGADVVEIIRMLIKTELEASRTAAE